MTFWTILRWAGTLIFVVMVVVSWLAADRSGSSGQYVRPAPIIIR